MTRNYHNFASYVILVSSLYKRAICIPTPGAVANNIGETISNGFKDKIADPVNRDIIKPVDNFFNHDLPTGFMKEIVKPSEQFFNYDLPNGFNQYITNPIKDGYYTMENGGKMLAGEAATAFQATGWMNKPPIPRPPPSDPNACNGLVEACKLPLDKMTFVSAHNAAMFHVACPNEKRVSWSELPSPFNTWSSVLPSVQPTCRAAIGLELLGPYGADCGYANQNYPLDQLLYAGVRMLGLVFVGYNPEDPTQPYTAHVSDPSHTALGYVVGKSAKEAFDIIGTFLDDYPREVIVISFNDNERDEALSRLDGAGSQKDLFDILRQSKAGKYLYTSATKTQNNGSWHTIGEMVAMNKRLVFHGVSSRDDAIKVPADIGFVKSEFDFAWGTWKESSSSANDLKQVAEMTCQTDRIVTLDSYLPYNGRCVFDLALHDAKPVLPDIFNSCTSKGASIFAAALDYIEPNDPVFQLVRDHIIEKSNKIN